MKRNIIKIKPQDLSFSYYLVDREDCIANLSIKIGQYIIRGFSIRKSKYGSSYFVSPPHRRLNGGKWAKLFWTNKENWTELESVVLKDFFNKHTLSK